MTEAWPDIAGRIEGGGHVLPVRVYYEDTDFTGRVYHAGFLRFCERGRSDFLRLAGIGHADLMAGAEAGEGSFFAVRRMAIDFLGPAGIDDLLEVRTRFRSASGVRLVIDQEVRRAARTLLRAEVTVVVLGTDGRPRRIAGLLRSGLAPLLAPTWAGGG
jgi:acyl-CoA thioester hydrolase